MRGTGSVTGHKIQFTPLCHTFVNPGLEEKQHTQGTFKAHFGHPDGTLVAPFWHPFALPFVNPGLARSRQRTTVKSTCLRTAW